MGLLFQQVIAGTQSGDCCGWRLEEPTFKSEAFSDLSCSL